MSEKLILSDKTFKIIGAAMEVHNTIGCGFTEPLYQEAFEEELRLRGISTDYLGCKNPHNPQNPPTTDNSIDRETAKNN